jgi:hypothetical protein
MNNYKSMILIYCKLISILFILIETNLAYNPYNMTGDLTRIIIVNVA